ncbi:unnamed protein product [Parnassius apollo]|uniref:Kinetochore protein SPC25 n=1 Tax=Parnassius apollo TaxID=110799 RepID=A0A8S3YFF7_PARAO|nr:unnamed protein product [Parnassius apollo]
MSTVKENWIYEIKFRNIDQYSLPAFEFHVNVSRECILKTIEESFLTVNYNHSNGTQNHDDDLRSLVETNKSLRLEIDIKFKDVQRQQTQYESFKHDQKLLSQEIKERHEAFLMAKKYYKKFLKIYFTIETKNDLKQTIFVQFFTEAKKDSENYSVRLLRNMENASYELLSTNPKLKNFKEIQRKLKERNDIPGALCCIRQSFINIKALKKQ